MSKAPADQGLSYNEKEVEGVLPAYFHDIGTLEFQDNLGRLWMDLGTADALALDVFINSFTVVSSEPYLGDVLGRSKADWVGAIIRAEHCGT
ncbi:hypothetical protein L7F22_014528 [Adiantum nelumboides]|nr:hypothetical protein [Adiantum nelumboides]